MKAKNSLSYKDINDINNIDDDNNNHNTIVYYYILLLEHDQICLKIIFIIKSHKLYEAENFVPKVSGNKISIC